MPKANLRPSDQAFRQWVRDYVPKRLVGRVSTDFHLHPDIPAKVLSGARSGYANAAPDEPFLVVYDNTLLGSATSGIVLTDRGIYWKGSSPARHACYEELEDVRFDGKKLVIRANSVEYRLGWPDMSKLTAGAAQPLGEVLQEVFQKARAECVAAAPKPVDSVDEVVRVAYGAGKNTIFIGADIPEKKLVNAKAEYVTIEPGERILALFDDTVFGSAKTGFCLTDRRLVWKGNTKGSLAYKELPGTLEARRDGSNLHLRVAAGSPTVTLTTWGTEHIVFLLEVLAGAAELAAGASVGADMGAFTLRQCWKAAGGVSKKRQKPASGPTAPLSSLTPATLPAEMRAAIVRDVPAVLREYASPKLLVAPDIPRDRAEAASAAYGALVPGEQVLALFDSTLSGTGAAGFCLTDLRIIWSGDGGGRALAYADVQDVRHGGDRLGLVTAGGEHEIGLAELATIQVDGVMTALLKVGNRLFGRGIDCLRVTRATLVSVGGNIQGVSGTLGMTSDSIAWLPDDASPRLRLPLEHIRGLQITADHRRLSFRDQDGGRIEVEVGEAAPRWVEIIDRAIAAVGGASPATAPAPAAVVIQAMTPHRSRSLSVTPEFDAKKLGNAQRKYLRLEPGEELLALFDDTFWGSGKKGFGLTDRRLLWIGEDDKVCEVAYARVRDVSQTGSILAFLLEGNEFGAFAMTTLDSELATAMSAMFARLVDEYRRHRQSGAEAGFRFLRTAVLALTEIDGTEIEPNNGVLCLTNHMLIWMDEKSNLATLSLADVKKCWKTLIGQTFWVERHTAKPGLLSSLGLGGHASLGWKAKGDAKEWVAAIDQAVADFPREAQ
jgi:hypothetical protein